MEEALFGLSKSKGAKTGIKIQVPSRYINGIRYPCSVTDMTKHPAIHVYTSNSISFTCILFTLGLNEERTSNVREEGISYLSLFLFEQRSLNPLAKGL